MPPATHMHRPRGFTLIELLTVVAIVGILAAILIPVVGEVQQSAQQTAGANAMRQVGSAIQLYTQDHNYALPGPLWPGQVPYFHPDRGEEDGRLAYFLAPYLDTTTAATPPVKVHAMIPPAFPIDSLGDEPRTYVMNTAAQNPPATLSVNFWGVHPALAQNESESTPAQLSQVANPASTWAIMDADREHPNVRNRGWATSTPEQPIYGNIRLALFFDGHVAEVDTTTGTP